MIRRSSVRFFLVVSPLPIWMQIAFGAAVLVGGATLWLNPGDVDSAFGSILMLQMFSASSGYRFAAASGYYDPLLVSGRSRAGIALGSLIAAAIPGVMAWLGIAVIATALGRGHSAFALHRQTALILVSAGAWAAGLALPRMAAGALWSVVLITLAMSRGAIGEYLAVVQSAPTSVYQGLSAAGAFAVCPYLLLGEFAAARSAGVIGFDLALAGALVWAGASYIARREYCLVEPA
jgi:hypothetical protein